MLLDPFPRFLFLPELPLPIYSCPSAPPQPPGQRWERRPGSAGSPEDGRAEQLETTWPEINIQRSEALTCGQYLLQVGEQVFSSCRRLLFPTRKASLLFRKSSDFGDFAPQHRGKWEGTAGPCGARPGSALGRVRRGLCQARSPPVPSAQPPQQVLPIPGAAGNRGAPRKGPAVGSWGGSREDRDGNRKGWEKTGTGMRQGWKRAGMETGRDGMRQER
ncbi:uncharacterized protein LOC115599830 isoform X2 [Calypte anna]|uniref:uncharacterized protein LOC115599830 isoform X2 n=1 Tax=Calypte anna TaxID=9244 RepID=UPI0011C398BA|nr:uncharacterized protein LOC115599830 isoform X2 [Calypte anna]